MILLESVVRREIGLLLVRRVFSSFLNSGIILTIFNLSGNIPVERVWFTIIVSGSISMSFMHFRRTVEMLSMS